MALTIITLTEVDTPAREKGRGWARVEELDCFATAPGREIEAEIGVRLNLVACCELSRGRGRSKRAFDRALIEVTGDPADTVSVVAGKRDPYRVVVTGARPWEADRSARVWTGPELAGHTQLVLSGNTFDHKDRIRELGGQWEPEARWWTYAIDDPDAAAGVATTLEGLGVTVTAR